MGSILTGPKKTTSAPVGANVSNRSRELQKYGTISWSFVLLMHTHFPSRYDRITARHPENGLGVNFNPLKTVLSGVPCNLAHLIPTSLLLLKFDKNNHGCIPKHLPGNLRLMNCNFFYSLDANPDAHAVNSVKATHTMSQRSRPLFHDNFGKSGALFYIFVC